MVKKEKMEQYMNLICERLANWTFDILAASKILNNANKNPFNAFIAKCYAI